MSILTHRTKAKRTLVFYASGARVTVEPDTKHRGWWRVTVEAPDAKLFDLLDENGRVIQTAVSEENNS